MPTDMPDRQAQIDELVGAVPAERRDRLRELIDAVRANVDPRFEERIDGRFMHWVVPISVYPEGYHLTPGEPLPFVSLANQKGYIALYHMGLDAYRERRPG